MTRTMSFVEAVADTAVGWLAALAAQLAVFPAVGLQATVAQSLAYSGAIPGITLGHGRLLDRLFSLMARLPANPDGP